MARVALIALAACVLATFGSGCGIILQSAVGWRSKGEPSRTTKQADVRVSTQPAEADISRRSRDGQTVPLGRSPLTDTVSYDVERSELSPQGWGLLLGGLAEAGAGAGLLLYGQGEKKCFSDGQCFETAAPDDKVMTAATIVFVTAGLELLIGLIHYSRDDMIEEKPLAPPEYSYIATRPGYLDASQTLKVPNEITSDGVTMRLEAAPFRPTPAPAIAKPPPPEPKNSAIPKDAVIAVMDVDDRNQDQQDRSIDPQVVRNLADQLRVFVGSRGWRAVDAGSQRKALEEQIQATKLDSYKNCFDESCQVELGKALAASHIMRASITRFGERCVLNSELVDLKSEVIVAAASSTGDCQAEGFLRMSEEVAKKLLP